MKTVVLFIPHLGVGGAELQLSLLAPRLRDAGWEPSVATIEEDRKSTRLNSSH